MAAAEGEPDAGDTSLHGEAWWPSRYGPDDEIGAGNELTPELTLAALRLPTQGRIIELARVLDRGVPIWPPPGVRPEAEGSRIYHQLVVAHGQLEEKVRGENRFSFMEEHVTQTYHVGTHLDGLGHVGIGGRYYNGLHYADFYRPTGLTRLGIETVRPWVSRGVCLDVAKVVGVDMLEEGFVITPGHLTAACAAAQVEVRAGDAVILHTGHGALWMTDNARYGNREPGLGLDGARWLTDRRVSLVGADNWAIEALPGERQNAPYVVHQHMLAVTGTHLLENLRTDELAACGRAEFLFICSPAKTGGSTASMVAPLAVV